jgi:hypothetical protein
MEQLAPAYRGTTSLTQARKTCEEYLSRSEQDGDTVGIARACLLLGWYHELHDDPKRTLDSRDLYERALRVARAEKLNDQVARACHFLAILLSRRGTEPERAEAFAREGIQIAEKTRDHRTLRRLQTARMWIAAGRDDWNTLREAFHDSIDSGGPEEYTLRLLLDRLEERCHRAGTSQEFRAFCRDLAEGYAHSGVAPPFFHWYLTPASLSVPGGEPSLQEEFDDARWAPELAWQDNSGGSRIDVNDRSGWVCIRPAEGTNLWPEQDLSAPRLMTRVSARPESAGEFIAMARLELGSPPRAFAGLLLWQDPTNFLRLELQPTELERIGVYFEGCVRGHFRFMGRGQCDPGPMWLRLDRVGDELRAYTSEDTRQWQDVGSVPFPRQSQERVGIAVGYRGVGACAWFDSFLLWRGEMEGE